MAKVQEVLDYVNAAQPNQFNDVVLVKWLNEAEGVVQTEIMKLATENLQKHDPDNLEEETVLGYPHDKLYGEYICARICEATGEVQKANNWLSRYNDFFDEFAKWWIRNYHPGQCRM